MLLLDEPTEHMDADAGAQLLRELFSHDATLVDSSRTVVVVTHQLPDGTAADQDMRRKSFCGKYVAVVVKWAYFSPLHKEGGSEIEVQTDA